VSAVAGGTQMALQCKILCFLEQQVHGFLVNSLASEQVVPSVCSSMTMLYKVVEVIAVDKNCFLLDARNQNFLHLQLLYLKSIGEKTYPDL
jgi:hypothetical protein